MVIHLNYFGKLIKLNTLPRCFMMLLVFVVQCFAHTECAALLVHRADRGQLQFGRVHREGSAVVVVHKLVRVLFYLEHHSVCRVGLHCLVVEVGLK